MKRTLVTFGVFAFLVANIGNLQAQTNANTGASKYIVKSNGGKVYQQCQKMAEFPGGFDAMYNFIAATLKYPSSAYENNIQGRVFLRFIIEKDGTIADIEVMKSLSEECDKEAVRVVKAMPKWHPAEENGEKVRQQFVLPITFSLAKQK